MLIEDLLAQIDGTVKRDDFRGIAGRTLTELVEEMRSNPEYAPAFRGTGSSGGGAPKSAASGGGGGPKTIAAGDQAAFMANLLDIASGKVTVSE